MAIHKFSVIFTFCLATLALWLARNDGHKESTLCYFAMTAHHCHLELPIESEKSKKFRKFKKIKILKTKIQKFRKFKKPKKYKNLENLKKIQKNPKIHTDFTQKFYNHTRKFYLRRKL